MTFQDFWNQNRRMLFHESTYSTAEVAWNAATAAERQRCREIAKQDAAHSCRQGLHADAWKSALRIADEIGE